MAFIKKIFNLSKELLKINLVKTLYFNYKFFPGKIAIQLPVVFYGKVIFKDLSGIIKIDSKEIKFGMIRFGGNHEIVKSSNSPTELLVKGNILFKNFATFGQGVKLVVWKNGQVYFGPNLSIGSDSHIVGFRKIVFGTNCMISWSCNIYDTDFHFIKDSITNEIADNCKEVIFGDSIWVGSHTTILKGTRFPDEVIIGSNSVCSGNYHLKISSKCILAGNPARVIKENNTYVVDKLEERVLFNKYINY